MSDGSNRSNRTLLIIIFGCVAFCCLGGGVLTFFGYRSGTAAVAEDGKFVTKVLTAVSDGDYKFESFEPYLTDDNKNEVLVKQWAPVLEVVRNRLGKFKSLGSATSFYLRNNNGEVSHDIAYRAEFEKASAIVKVVIVNPGSEKQKIRAMRFNSEIFNDLFRKKAK